MTMTHKLRNDESGFTLIELLVVILIIGVLAAIALPTFLGQRTKGQDAAAKSDARAAVTAVESCATEATGANPYASCDTLAELDTAGSSVSDKVVLTANTAFPLRVTSKSGTVFTVSKSGNTISRTCDVSGKGGCSADGDW